MQDLSLMLLTACGNKSVPSYLEFIARALDLGVNCIQLREKSWNSAELHSFGIHLRGLTRARNAALIVNDDLMLAKVLRADGVHLGQNDGDPDAARAILGPDAIVGYTVNTPQQLAHANQLDCLSYVGIAAIFPSLTKPECSHLWGSAGLAAAMRSSRHRVTAIGGITRENVDEVYSTGCRSIAVTQVIHATRDLAQTIGQLRKQP